MNTHPADGRISYVMVERKVGDLMVDPNVQRNLKKARVHKMAPKFDAAALGTLTTSFRSPQLIHIVDGQHRYRLCEQVGYTGVIMTQEYHGLTIPEEAALFRKLNTSEKPTAIDQFLVGVVEQDPACVNLAAILAEQGWEVSSNAGEGRITAVANMERVYAIGPDVAKATLRVITAAWGRRPSGVQGSLLLGVGRMIGRYGTGVVNLDDLAVRLAKVPGGPDGLLGNAKGLKLSQAGDLSTQVARILVGLYNQRRKTTGLPAWDS